MSRKKLTEQEQALVVHLSLVTLAMLAIILVVSIVINAVFVNVYPNYVYMDDSDAMEACCD